MARAPGNASLKDLGVEDQHIHKLSPSGKGVTKDDLIALFEPHPNARTRSLTLEDIDTIKQAFDPILKGVGQPVGGALMIACCCCPCCCATAVLEPAAKLS